MGCGSIERKGGGEEMPQPVRANYIDQEEDVGVLITHPSTSFVLPGTGSVEMISMRFLIKYNPKEQRLESYIDQGETVTSTLSWETQEDSITFTLKDEYLENILTKKRTRIPEFPYQWMTTKDGRYVI